MKSLVLKDLFNICHNAKSMLFILVAFAAAFIPFSGVEGYNLRVRHPVQHDDCNNFLF